MNVEGERESTKMNPLLRTVARVVTRIVCKRDVPVDITDGEISSMDAKGEIHISRSVLDADPLQALRDFRVHVAHLTSHIYLTELDKWRLWYRNDRLRHLIANLIEDYRCDNFVLNRYDGLKRDYASFKAYSFMRCMNMQDVKPQVRFHVALIHCCILGRIKGDVSLLAEKQLDKIEEVKKLLEEVKWAYLFEEKLLPCAEKIFKIIREEYPEPPNPNYDSDSQVISKEIVVEEKERKGEEIELKVEQRKDDEDVEGKGREEETISEGAEKDVKSYVEQVTREFSDRSKVDLGATEAEKALIRMIFNIDIDREKMKILKEKRDEKVRKLYSKEPLEVRVAEENFDFFEACRKEVAPHARRIISEFQFIQQEYDWEDDYRTGATLASDFIQRLLNRDERVFKRYIEREQDMKWLILTDVSSSVSVDEVTRVTTLLAEVAHNVLQDDNFCICAFSNHFYVVKDFDEGYDKIVKGRIGGVYSGGTTNICDSIEFCITRFNVIPSETKVMFVITDAEPNTCREEEPQKHTKAAVEKAFLNGILTVGIGVCDFQNVGNYFPVNFVIHSLDEFPLTLLNVYSRILAQDKGVYGVGGLNT